MAPPEAACRHLFVYGTLMSAATDVLGRGMRARLRRGARCLGGATFAGCLYLVDRYPGAKPCPHAPDCRRCRVEGEVWELREPEPTLRMLDDYEGLGAPEPQYERRMASVRHDDGDRLEAWIYLWLGDSRSRRLIPGGSWINRRR